VYHGHDRTRRWHQDLDDACEGLHADPEEYFDLGEHTVAFYVCALRNFDLSEDSHP
jgi:hypothetical protein